MVTWDNHPCRASWRAVMNAEAEDNRAPQQSPLMVATGASAGGVAALQNFFAALPERTGAAFVVVVHLDPQHRSELPRIISGRTKMPVVQVEHREKLHPDHV